MKIHLNLSKRRRKRMQHKRLKKRQSMKVMQGRWLHQVRILLIIQLRINQAYNKVFQMLLQLKEQQKKLNFIQMIFLYFNLQKKREIKMDSILMYLLKKLCKINHKMKEIQWQHIMVNILKMNLEPQLIRKLLKLSSIQLIQKEILLKLKAKMVQFPSELEIYRHTDIINHLLWKLAL